MLEHAGTVNNRAAIQLRSLALEHLSHLLAVAFCHVRMCFTLIRRIFEQAHL